MNGIPLLNEWVATDLDGTLFSRAWDHPTAIPGTWRDRAQVGGQNVREPSSWVRRETHQLLHALGKTAALVPVTARDMDSFSRVEIPDLRLSGPAILANGAIVLNWEGQPDKGWEDQMNLLLGPWETRLHDLCAKLIRQCKGAARPRLVASHSSLPAYLVAKAADGWWTRQEGVAVLHQGDLWEGCHLAVLGNELQVLPPGLGKREAALYVQQNWFGNRPPLLTLGDMHADLEFMRLGGFMATPPGSVLDCLWPARETCPLPPA